MDRRRGGGAIAEEAIGEEEAIGRSGGGAIGEEAIGEEEATGRSGRRGDR